MFFRAEIQLKNSDGGYIGTFDNLDNMRNWINHVREDRHGHVKIWKSNNTAFVISNPADKIIEF